MMQFAMRTQESLGLLNYNSQDQKQNLLTFHKAEWDKRILPYLGILLPTLFTGRIIDTKNLPRSKEK